MTPARLGRARLLPSRSHEQAPARPKPPPPAGAPTCRSAHMRFETCSSLTRPIEPINSSAGRTSGRSPPVKSSTSSARSSASSRCPQTSNTGRLSCVRTAATTAATLLPHRPLAVTALDSCSARAAHSARAQQQAARSNREGSASWSQNRRNSLARRKGVVHACAISARGEQRHVVIPRASRSLFRQGIVDLAQ